MEGEPGMGKGRVKPRIARRGCDPGGDSDECGSSDGWAHLGPLCSVIRQRGVQDLSECSVRCHCPFITALLKPSRRKFNWCVCVCVYSRDVGSEDFDARNLYVVASSSRI